MKSLLRKRILTPEQKTELVNAKAAGKAAFHAGIKCAPFYDATFMAGMTYGPIGDPASITAEKMTAWSEGWHQENANAGGPIPGLDRGWEHAKD